MFFNSQTPILAGCLIGFLSLLHSSDAFGVTSTLQTPRSITSTALQAKRGSRRRDFFDTVKRVFVGAGTAAALSKGATLPAFAEDSSTAGKIVDIQIENLDGEPGKTGSVRVQLRPEWAPRGVARFEVSSI